MIDKNKKSIYLFTVILFVIVIALISVLYKFQLFEKSIISPISVITNGSLVSSEQSSQMLIQNISNKIYYQNQFLVKYEGNVTFGSNIYSYSEPINFTIIKNGNYYRINYSINSSSGFLFTNASGFVSCNKVSNGYKCDYINLYVQPQVSFGILIYLFSRNPQVSYILSNSPYNFTDLLSTNKYLLFKKIGQSEIYNFNCSIENVYQYNLSVSIGNICLSNKIGLPLLINLSFTGSNSFFDMHFIPSIISNSTISENISYIPSNLSIS